MALCLFVVPTGHHEASWRLPGSPAERLYDLHYYADLAQQAEAAGLHAIFFADAPALRTNVEHNTGGSVLEPFTLLGALAASTRSIGLIGTASTTYAEPYNVARAFSSLDHLSCGRVGWNIVTTAFAGAAANFGRAPHAGKEERYRRADEFVAVTKRLWDSWAADAIVCDRAAGRYAEPGRITATDHAGRYFAVRGPFQSARSPQRYPVLVQAGASEPGRAFAARHAEVVFSVQRWREASQDFRTDLHRRARQAGRDPRGVLMLPGLSVHVGRTHAEARAMAEELKALVVPAHGIAQIRKITGVDLSGHGLDEVITTEPFRSMPGEDRFASRRTEIVDMIEEERQTLRRLPERVADARTHRVLVGTPGEVADEMQRWAESGACDGFNVMPPVLPDGLTRFVELVLPELRRRGCWAPPGDGLPLRARLGLPPPA
jgi:FMN-dependent oxidoreductase (nitrilotriacetate monooxygenase family)